MNFGNLSKTIDLLKKYIPEEKYCFGCEHDEMYLWLPDGVDFSPEDEALMLEFDWIKEEDNDESGVWMAYF